MATARHRSLIERGVRKAFDRDKDLAHTKNNVRKNPIFTNLKKNIPAQRAFSKATRLFFTK